jgi:pectinesterase
MDAHIRPEGWDNWNNTPANEKTAWFGEFDCTGPGAAHDKRVTWSHQLTAKEAEEFYPKVFLKGSDNWDPTSTRF